MGEVMEEFKKSLPLGWEKGDAVYQYYETKDGAPWTKATPEDDRILQKTTQDRPVGDTDFFVWYETWSEQKIEVCRAGGIKWKLGWLMSKGMLEYINDNLVTA